ncbi:trimethylamine methyltransferase family protein [Roseovarius sp. MMSF_3281]|uniref:trimethylamine methyltransferase family protein n=1 Tax=Roseovarius sp. MMSF_3281 TaxID=3046694 RepID=UPI00273FB522|nr:trimethylamine methyltransferase family protein [Roseovarius sp. MMSF_3281]
MTSTMREQGRRGRRRRDGAAKSRAARVVNYSRLRNLLSPQTVFSQDEAEAIHAEVLTAITFISNVDMRSGAPAFGTPEHFKASLGAGQLARFLDLPWSCASGSAANINDALSKVPSGGHFFGATHTMERYQTEFYQSLVADLSNFGTWSERGALSAPERAVGIWKDIVDGHRAPETAEPGRLDALRTSVAKRSAVGGAPPVS